MEGNGMTHTTDNGGPAFPSEQGFDPDGKWNQSYDPGMTLRDYFAGQALTGFASSMGDVAVPYWELMARDAYAVADAMLAARKGGAE